MNANTKPDPITAAPQPSQAPAINQGPPQLNAAARYALKALLPKLAPEVQEPAGQEPETITLQDLAQRISR